ncbi:MAG TPA: LacI family DNA-binding transcriptional regulator [Ktedonobacterales bacterium]|jgi:LacI family transcriptional regulator
MPKKVTILDVARLAGVSRTTVSRVLNQKGEVDPATRERVQRIIEEQSFVPSLTAAGLAGGHSRLIGMLVPTFTWTMIPELLRGIADVINNTPYELVLYSYNDEDLSRDQSVIIKRVMATQLTAGILAVFPGRISAQLTRLYQQGLPVVVIDDQFDQTIPWVHADNVTGAYLAVQHLIQLGHRRIAHIQGPPEYLASHDRYNGYRRALQEVGITPDPELVLTGDFLPPSGRACAEQLFVLPPEKRPTAIFAATDQMAYGVLSAAEEHGLSVPGDVALVGFDDDTPSAHVRPPLTTIRQPSFEMGKSGIELVLSLVAASDEPAAQQHSLFKSTKDGSTPVQPHPIKPARIELQTSLIVRASCGSSYHVDWQHSNSKMGGTQS